MFRFYNKVYEILSSGLFLSILTSSWTFLFFSILPLGYGFFALPLGLIIGIISFLGLIKALISIGLLPKEIDDNRSSQNVFSQPQISQEQNQQQALPSGENSEILDLDKFWDDVDTLDLDELQKERIREIIIENRT